MKKCSSCFVKKPLDEFFKKARSTDGYDSQCKPCNYSHKRSYMQPSTKVAIPSWVTSAETLEGKLKHWFIWTMMRQRNITLQDLGEVMEVSRERARQLIMRTDDPNGLERIENAITYITIKRHQEAGHNDNDLYCGVYTACGMDKRVAQAKAAGEREYEQAS